MRLEPTRKLFASVAQILRECSIMGRVLRKVSDNGTLAQTLRPINPELILRRPHWHRIAASMKRANRVL